MATQTITLTFDPKTAKMDIETSGFKGQACMKETEQLMKMIGSVDKTTPKPEMYEKELGGGVKIGN